MYNTRYQENGNPVFRQLAQFWTKVFAISFVIGVASGFVMEFQFGTNWAGYSRFVGDIFGAPLAAEGIFAFFLESSFLGILLYGRKKVSQKMYWFSSLMVASGAMARGPGNYTKNGQTLVRGMVSLLNGRLET